MPREHQDDTKIWVFTRPLLKDVLLYVTLVVGGIRASGVIGDDGLTTSEVPYLLLRFAIAAFIAAALGGSLRAFLAGYRK